MTSMMFDTWFKDKERYFKFLLDDPKIEPMVLRKVFQYMFESGQQQGQLEGYTLCNKHQGHWIDLFFNAHERTKNN